MEKKRIGRPGEVGYFVEMVWYCYGISKNSSFWLQTGFLKHSATVITLATVLKIQLWHTSKTPPGQLSSSNQFPHAHIPGTGSSMWLRSRKGPQVDGEWGSHVYDGRRMHKVHFRLCSSLSLVQSLQICIQSLFSAMLVLANDLNSIFTLQITDVAYHFSETKVLIKASCNPSCWEPTLVNLNMIHGL